ncbi:hypothetical protein DICVIV_10032 [Dictyocaulus viviparus]|uniref:ARMC9 CTLH-like domain-containing protein n=1 Tax=Dictyocaulus viviparus TaxID=29172 RepID=A0A0D8XH67_DICVI|nr:hypothetical protein DICVIV_10032 [Dictyocaulus viviparus]
MYRLYLIKCMENKRIEKCNQFFLKCVVLTQNNPVWTEWFTFPYHPNPQGCQTFRKYYSNEWREVFVISLHNFVRMAIQLAPKSHLMQLVELLSEDMGASSFCGRALTVANCAVDDELIDDFAVIAQLWEKCDTMSKSERFFGPKCVAFFLVKQRTPLNINSPVGSAFYNKSSVFWWSKKFNKADKDLGVLKRSGYPEVDND